MNKEELIERNRKALEKRQPGDIIFFHPATFGIFSSIILFVTGQYYHHGAIVVDESTLIEGDPNIGVHIGQLEGYLDQYQLDLFRLKNPIDGQLIVQMAKKYEGWRYDYGNVLWAGIGFVWLRLTGLNLFRKLVNPYDDAEAFDSEEYIAQVFIDCGIVLCPDIPSTNVSAQNIADSELLEKII